MTCELGDEQRAACIDDEDEGLRHCAEWCEYLSLPDVGRSAHRIEPVADSARAVYAK